MNKIVIIFCLFISGCAYFVNPMIRAANNHYIRSMVMNDCERTDNKNACSNIGRCLMNSGNLSFTNKQLADYRSGIDYSNLAYKNEQNQLPIYNLWHPDEIVYENNTVKRQEDNRKKIKNFQIIQNTISSCYAENGLDVQKTLNSYRP